MNLNNKAVSPIIATVLLITIVVIIAGVVYKSGNGFLAQLSPPADCSQVSFNAGIFQEADGIKTIELENTGNPTIEAISLQITTQSTGSSDSIDLFLSAEKGQSAKQSINVEIPKDSKIKIIPQIRNAKDEISPCPKEFGKIVDLVIISK